MSEKVGPNQRVVDWCKTHDAPREDDHPWCWLDAIGPVVKDDCDFEDADDE